MNSIIKYGSVIRGNSDKYSDKDVLIVADNFDELNSLNNYYSSKGWSTSLYTYSKLEYLAKKGFLFVKHLINEGEIIKDDNGFLNDILQQFEEKLDYNHEIKKSSEFINYLNIIPNTIESYFWLCDNIYIALRNSLIYKSALKNEFLFSYVDLIKSLLNAKAITENEYDTLLQLRVVKSCYRNNYKDIYPSLDYTNKVIRLANKIGLNLDIKFSKNINCLNLVDYDKIDSSYKKLRFIELILKNESIEDAYLTKCISNPQMYANSRHIEKIYLRTISKIKTSHNIVLAKWRV